MRGIAFVVVLACAAPANAFTFRVKGQTLRLDITESFYSAYNGDLGGLIIEKDKFDRATTNYRFIDILNRLNVDLAWKNLRFFTRFDTAVYFDWNGDTQSFDAPPHGGCGPELTTPATVLSRYCENYFYLEKIALEYTSRNVEATLGDFYVSFGRGLVLSIRKLDELGIDTTVLGARLVYHEGNLAATLVLGGTNVQNVDEATGRWVENPYDMIAGARIEYRFLDKIIVGLHEAGGLLSSNITDTQVHPDSMFNYGGSIDAPRLTRWLGLYFEAAGQTLSSADTRQTGYAIYGAATGYFGPASVLLEVKHYSTFHRWRSSLNRSFAEFAPVSYNQPPTAERVQTELIAPIYDVTGPRLRVDWRVNRRLVLYASYGFFEDRGLPNTGVLRYHDPYGGAEIRWNEGRSHLFPSGGYRIERCADQVQTCLESTPDNAGEFQHVGHVEWDFAQWLPHGFSIEAQGFVLMRQGDLTTTTVKIPFVRGLPVGRPFSTAVVYPDWVEGDAYFALKWTPHLVATFGYEFSTRPSSKVNQHFFNGALQYNITTASSIRVFVGGTRGGLKCISGICRDFPPFTGARLEVVVRL
jgi:Family of unknown function (DUF6029)